MFKQQAFDTWNHHSLINEDSSSNNFQGIIPPNKNQIKPISKSLEKKEYVQNSFNPFPTNLDKKDYNNSSNHYRKDNQKGFFNNIDKNKFNLEKQIINQKYDILENSQIPLKNTNNLKRFTNDNYSKKNNNFYNKGYNGNLNSEFDKKGKKVSETQSFWSLRQEIYSKKVAEKEYEKDFEMNFIEDNSQFKNNKFESSINFFDK